MITHVQFRALVLSFPEVVEEPHFEKASFRVTKKIFATLDEHANRVGLKLSEMDQDLFSAIDNEVMIPVPNKWGRKGWTFMNLAKAKQGLALDALTCAYRQVAPTRLISLIDGHRN